MLAKKKRGQGLVKAGKREMEIGTPIIVSTILKNPKNKHVKNIFWFPVVYRESLGAYSPMPLVLLRYPSSHVVSSYFMNIHYGVSQSGAGDKINRTTIWVLTLTIVPVWWVRWTVTKQWQCMLWENTQPKGPLEVSWERSISCSLHCSYLAWSHYIASRTS